MLEARERSKHLLELTRDKTISEQRLTARLKRRATAVPNSIDRIKFDFSTEVVRRLKPSRATAV